MGALFEQAAIGDRNRGIGKRGDDMSAAVNLLRATAYFHLNAVLRGHFGAEFLPVGFGRAEDLQLLYFAIQFQNLCRKDFVRYFYWTFKRVPAQSLYFFYLLLFQHLNFDEFALKYITFSFVNFV